MSFDPQILKNQFNPEGSDLRNMQYRMLVLLDKVDELCRKHNLRYWLVGGTLLGAVRHKGFIPWDDDLDIEMLKEDYDKLMIIMQQELPDSMAIQCMETDENYFFQFAKLRDRRSFLAEGEHGYDRVWKERGIFIDIFPVERVPLWAHKLSCATFGHIYKILNTHVGREDEAMKSVRRWLLFNTKFVFPLLRVIAKVLPVSYYDDALGIPYYVKRQSDKMFPLKEVEFEGKMYPALGDHIEQLTAQYGDFMQLPKNPQATHATTLEIQPL